MVPTIIVSLSHLSRSLSLLYPNSNLGDIIFPLRGVGTLAWLQGKAESRERIARRKGRGSGAGSISSGQVGAIRGKMRPLVGVLERRARDARKRRLGEALRGFSMTLGKF